MSDLTLVKCRRCGYVRRISPVTIPCAKCKKYGTFVEYKAPQPTADRGTRTGKGLGEAQSEASPISARPLSVGLVESMRRLDDEIAEVRRRWKNVASGGSLFANFDLLRLKAYGDGLAQAKEILETECAIGPAESVEISHAEKKT